MTTPSNDMNAFRELIRGCKNLVILTGAGVSAESGIPTFRGAGGLWRRWNATDLASPEAFRENPSLVWEFYHHRRELMSNKNPNNAHIAIAECEERFNSEGRKVAVITQNIDGLHKRAGSERILELHGNLFKTRCLKCRDVEVNMNSPICEALRGKGAPDPSIVSERIPESDLPRCRCGGLLRPDVVWFGEPLDSAVLDKVDKELSDCDLCMLVGTSSVVYPAANFAPALAARGVPVGEFNMEQTWATNQLGFHFHGPAGENVPKALTP